MESCVRFNDKELIDLLYESTVDQFGIFYTLDEAFDNNFLTVEALKQKKN
jgi:hypothetical protein